MIKKTGLVSPFRSSLLNSRLQVLDNPGNTLASAHTGGYHALFFVQPFHIMQVLNSKLTTCASKRVPKGNSSPIDIHL